MPPKPTLILLHGAFHSPAHFEPLIAYLTTHGYTCLPVALPSTHSTTPATFADDISVVRAAIIPELARNNVAIVAHSFGGITGMSSLQDLTPAVRKAAGFSTAVTHACLISANFGLEGKSAPEMLGDRLVPIAEIKGDWCYVGPKSPRAYFYHDLPVEEAEHWSAMLKPTSLSSFMGKVTHEGWREVAASYLVCKDDRAFTEDVQRWLIGVAKENGADFRVEEIDSSHSPFLSHVERTGDFVRRGVGELR